MNIVFLHNASVFSKPIISKEIKPIIKKYPNMVKCIIIFSNFMEITNSN